MVEVEITDKTTRWCFLNQNLTDINGDIDEDVLNQIPVISSKISIFHMRRSPSLLWMELISESEWPILSFSFLH